MRPLWPGSVPEPAWGWLSFFKTNHPVKENVAILALLYVISAAVGVILEIFL